VRIGDYVLEGELGRGGMGCVYTGRHAPTGALRAVKVLDHGGDPEAIVRFQREAEALARAGSAVAVPIHESGREQGRFYFVMELMTGGSLEKRMKGPLPWREAATLVADLARKVAKLHAVGLVHRDLKPANVLFAEDGSARIADFGCMRDLSKSVLTQTGALLGTPAYMAPEQLGGEAVGTPADVFALGAILHELVAGARPYTGASWLEVMKRQQRGERLRLEPAALETIVASALAADPTHRPSALGLAAELESLVLRGEKLSRSRLAVLVLAIVAALGTVVGLALRPATDRRNPNAPEVGPVTSPVPATPVTTAASEASPEDRAAGSALDEALRKLVLRAARLAGGSHASLFERQKRDGDWVQATSDLLAAAARFSDGARRQAELVRRFEDRPTETELEAVATLWERCTKDSEDTPGPVSPGALCRAPLSGWRRGALLAYFGRPTFGGNGQPIDIAELTTELFASPGPDRWRYMFYETRIRRLVGLAPEQLSGAWGDTQIQLACDDAESAFNAWGGGHAQDLANTLENGVRLMLECARTPGNADPAADLERARRLIDKSLQYLGDPYVLAIRRGEVEFAAGNYEAALRAFRAAPHDAKPESVAYVDAHVALAAVEANRPDAKQLAEQAYRESELEFREGRSHQSVLVASLARALVYVRDGDSAGASAEIERIRTRGAYRASLGYDPLKACERIEAERRRQSERR